MKKSVAWLMTWCGAAALAMLVCAPNAGASEAEPASSGGVPAAQEAKWDLQVGWYLPALSTKIRAEPSKSSNISASPMHK